MGLANEWELNAQVRGGSGTLALIVIISLSLEICNNNIYKKFYCKLAMASLVTRCYLVLGDHRGFNKFLFMAYNIYIYMVHILYETQFFVKLCKIFKWL